MIKLKISSDLSGKIAENIEKNKPLAEQLLLANGEGNDFLGWVNLPNQISEELLSTIENTAAKIRSIAESVIVIGIGGSYLGARAVISAIKGEFAQDEPSIYYAGHHLSQDYMYELLQKIDNEDYTLIVISKSGTTLEPAIAFRFLQQHCQKKYGKNGAKERIFCITDAQKGALKVLADKEGYTTFVIPDDVGGRYSVLTSVGLLPIAVAGIDIRALLNGAKQMLDSLTFLDENNQAYIYALCRNYFISQGKQIEVLTSFESRFYYLIEWWKQLFGESEGKQHKGLFPAGLLYTTDLHSMGQYMQEGQRLFFETFLSLKRSNHHLQIPHSDEDFDGLNFLENCTMDFVNTKAEQGTILAHQQGGVPTLQIEIDTLDAFHIGALMYFFEYACGLSAYILGVNPFNQPGVEAYKINMFTLLKKKGFEDKYDELQKKIDQL